MLNLLRKSDINKDDRNLGHAKVLIMKDISSALEVNKQHNILTSSHTGTKRAHGSVVG
jgi:hypothetical protein